MSTHAEAITTTKWAVDPAHSEVTFKVRHLMITTVTGTFGEFTLEAETEGDDFNSVSNIEFVADTKSISTKNEQRDTHLRSADFFDVEKYGEIRFTGRNYSVEGDQAVLKGDLTIKDISKPLVLKVEFGGIVKDPYGQTKAGFTVEGKISRKDFGLTWNAMTEAGQVVVSDEIRVHCEIQLIKEEG